VGGEAGGVPHEGPGDEAGAEAGGGGAAAAAPHAGDGAGGAPQFGDADGGLEGEVTAGEAGDPQPPGAGGGATMVGATGRAGVGGAHVAATPAVWLVGAAGRTGGADFFFLRRRRVIR